MENHYQDKFEEYIRNMNNLKFTFEITKSCGYSSFITIYKNQTIIDLYSIIICHFGNIQIKDLYFLTPNNEHISIPISNQILSEFVRSNIICNPIKLFPIYDISKPVIYKLYFDDGYCSDHQCSTIHYHN